jgi:uncharacterized protein (TIGR02466 family)
MKMTPEVFDIFPTPIARYERLLDKELIAELVEYFDRQARIENVNSANLSHTQMVAPEKHSSFQRLSQLVETPLVEFGKLIFGETLHWSIKEMWVNHLEHGGRQSLHNHANSFVSGVIYLTESDPSANTVFAKSPGGHEFVFNNTNARAALGPYNAGKWVSPDPAPGDMILFPSYLLHEVPTNKGNRRISMAFNAIPDRLDSWGYTLSLSR